MNLKCNYIKNRYINPNLNIYARVENQVPQCLLFFILKYFYDGRWITKTTNPFKCGKCARLYYQNSSSQRECTIYKRVEGTDTFIFNGMILGDNPVCYKVTGSTMHTFINKVPC